MFCLDFVVELEKHAKANSETIKYLVNSIKFIAYK